MNSNVLVAGAGGFIGGELTKLFLLRGDRVRAVDKKPLPEWHQRFAVAENLCLDLSDWLDCDRAVEGIDIVCNLAAEMGGMGFIEKNRVACLRNVLINTNLIEAAYRAGVYKYFFSSSACVYNAESQKDPNVTALKESDAYPAMAERGYGWEKLISEMVCQEYWAERGMRTYIARFHNVYGPHGSWRGGREKAPAALCRKIAEAKLYGKSQIDIWGDGTQTRSFTFIKDCVEGIYRIINCNDLIATPINLGSSELVSINQLVSIIASIAGVRLDQIVYNLDAPKGVNGRNSDNTLIIDKLGWQPYIPLSVGLEYTYKWIEEEIRKMNKTV